MDVLCIGLMVCDIIIKPVCPDIFKLDSTRLDTLKTASGGDALNVAVNLSKMGLQVGLIGKVGNDTLGTYLIEEAERFGVNTSLILKTDEYATSTSIVMVEESGERHFTYYGKANDSLCIQDINEAILKQTKIVHVGSAMALNGLDGEDLGKLFKAAKTAGCTTSLDVTWDVSGRWLDKIDSALHWTDIFMPSYDEAKHITGLEKPEEMRGFFKKYGFKALAVKLGAEGCYVTDYTNEYRIPTFEQMTAVDTTGAGDAFVSGFLAGVAREWRLYDCGVLGNAAASHCITDLGATSGTKSLSDLINFISTNGKPIE